MPSSRNLPFATGVRRDGDTAARSSTHRDADHAYLRPLAIDPRYRVASVLSLPRLCGGAGAAHVSFAT
jgi:hypothetical protein